jgi:hypothetical protein
MTVSRYWAAAAMLTLSALCYLASQLIQAGPGRQAETDRSSCITQLTSICAMKLSARLVVAGEARWFSHTPYVLAFSPSRFDIGSSSEPVTLAVMSEMTKGPVKLKGTVVASGRDFPVEIEEGVDTTLTLADSKMLTLRLTNDPKK